jgi:hypothetical protein
LAVYTKVITEEIRMKIKNYMFFAVFMLSMVLSSIGIAVAEDEAEMTNQQYCEKEAKDAGMTEGKEASDYIAQCLADIEAQKKSDAEAGS